MVAGSSLAVPTQYGTGALDVAAGLALVSVVPFAKEIPAMIYGTERGGGVAHMFTSSRRHCYCVFTERAGTLW